MGHFTINLPDNRLAEVRRGTVRKLGSPLDVLPWRKIKRVEKTGYIITIQPAIQRKNEYRLFRTKEGQWSHDADGRIQLADETTLAIKKAILEYEDLHG